MASFDFDTITAAQALAFNGSTDEVVVNRYPNNITIRFDDPARQVVVTETISGRSVVFGEGIYGETIRGNPVTLGSPAGDYIPWNIRTHAGAGNDTIAGGSEVYGGQGQDLFVSRDASYMTRIHDWEAHDSLSMSVVPTSAEEYVEATRTDFAAAQTFARDQIQAGKSYVVVAVGADLEVFADRHGYNDWQMGVSRTTIVGRGLNDISQSNFVGADQPPRDPSLPPLPPPPPTFSAVGTISGNMDSLRLGSLLGADIETATATGLVLRSASGRLGLEGTSFTYDAHDQLLGGTATRILYQTPGPLFLDLKVTVSAQQFGRWVAQDATQEALSTILAGNDNFGGTPNADLLRGYGGNDLLYGVGGGDSIYGGDGNDALYALYSPQYTGGHGGGTSLLRGEAGNDTLVGGDLFDDMHGNMGSDSLRGEAGGDWVVGGQDNDTLSGGGGADIVYGNLGNDLSYGDGGNDFVRGGQGDDLVEGGSGDDWLSGDRGTDTLTGGTGADHFHIFAGAGQDRVTDFSYAAGDRVNLLPGVTYTATQVGGDTVVDLGSGDRIVLVGVQQSSLGANWLVFG